MVQQRGETVEIPPFCRVPKVGDWRSGGCGRELSETTSGVAQGRPQSASSLDMYERRPQCWSFWWTPGWARCRGGSSLRGGPDVEEDGLEEIEMWAPEGGAGESEISEEDGPGPLP